MKKCNSVVIKFLFILNIFAVFFLIASDIAAYINPGKVWSFAFFGLAYPFILFINLFFILLWLLLWNKFIFLSLFTILLGWNNLQTICPFPSFENKSVTKDQLTLVSYNVDLFWGVQRSDIVPEIHSSITQFLASKKADIICLQEFYAVSSDFQKTLKTYAESIGFKHFFFHNYREFRNKQKIDALITFSKYPIINNGILKYPEKGLYAIYTDVIINQDTVRIYNLHLESIRFGNDDYSFYSKLTDQMDENTPIKEGTKKMLWKLRRAFIMRAEEVESLKSHLSACPYPILVAGDFNDTPSSYTYHQLTKDLKDAYRSTGAESYGSTYAGLFPAFRIDYILYSSFFKAVKYQKYRLNYSDHYPVTASFTLTP
ncbi:MAG: endonuclease/exonuclease/phosphatase family protein [Bacteroidales bacterium]|nr:endonuclease/exonuclease/phosphatase family protein [Bacteroidales bacterium]